MSEKVGLLAFFNKLQKNAIQEMDSQLMAAGKCRHSHFSENGYSIL